MSHNPFLPEDSWKQEAVNRALSELRRQESAKQQQKVQECVRWFLDAKENSNHNKK